MVEFDTLITCHVDFHGFWISYAVNPRESYRKSQVQDLKLSQVAEATQRQNSSNSTSPPRFLQKHHEASTAIRPSELARIASICCMTLLSLQLVPSFQPVEAVKQRPRVHHLSESCWMLLHVAVPQGQLVGKRRSLFHMGKHSESMVKLFRPY